MLSGKNCGELTGEASTQGWDEHHLTGGEQLHCAALVLYIILLLLLLLFPSFSVLLNRLYLNPQVFNFFFLILSPSHCGGVSEQLCGAQLSVGLNHNSEKKIYSDICAVYVLLSFD